jgi:hypothetical protein
LNAWNFCVITHSSANYASFNFGASSYLGDAQLILPFTVTLSISEIRNWYLEGLRQLNGASLAGLMDGLVAYYDMRGDTNDIVGGKNGTVSGATLTTDIL